MKRSTVYIKPHKLSEVTLALYHVEGLTGVSASDAKDFGPERAARRRGGGF